jgi:hypothetical protein
LNEECKAEEFLRQSFFALREDFLIVARAPRREESDPRRGTKEHEGREDESSFSSSSRVHQLNEEPKSRTRRGRRGATSLEGGDSAFRAGFSALFIALALCMKSLLRVPSCPFVDNFLGQMA